MGLDMYFNKIKTRIASQEELEKSIFPLIESGDSVFDIEEIGYFRKHSDLHGYFQELWLKRTIKNEPSPDDFNMVPLLLTKEDIEEVLKKARNQIIGKKEFEEARGFFWGASCEEDWVNTIHLFKWILSTTDFEKESIYYESWW